MNSQSSAQNIILDHHDYQIFSPEEVSRTPQEHIQTACSIGNNLVQSDKWLIVGEWTGAQTGKNTCNIALRTMNANKATRLC